MSDSGLQPERTGLAYLRTGLLALIVASLHVRVGLSDANFIHLFSATLLGGMAGALLCHGHKRSRHQERERVVTSTSRLLSLMVGIIVALTALVQTTLIFIRLMQ